MRRRKLFAQAGVSGTAERRRYSVWHWEAYDVASGRVLERLSECAEKDLFSNAVRKVERART